jgi:hypothetical protein
MDHVRRCKLFAISTLLVGAFSFQGVHPALADSQKTSIQPLVVYGVGSVVPGTGSILVRTKEGVGATLHTFGLVPGNAYTLWVGVFNNPTECATTPCSAADLPNPDVQAVVFWGSGQIAGEDGTVDLGAFRAVGDTSGSAGLGTATALEKPFKAQIHLAVRSHGPASADPAVLQQQLSTFNGGCPPNTCANVQVAVH